ncbi:hypothetical protein PN498_01610 [Oscillatoria sp. CS-180]|uniref:hypothetical protein n=1 Tax=Oscillatoria sp. CS-180 TaxID=3021720 RepID=UPI00232DC3E9|nr:hypothetical protein [Oscillatoria sp. CS-180]MDB9524671.1 hypothetical protein [Oscillatoria sp. CS-180]
MGLRAGFIARAGFLGIGIIAGLRPAPAIARTCQAVAPILPSDELKEFRIHAFDLALNIPSNYRSMLRTDGHITFHDPGSFDLIQCLIRTGEYREIPLYAALEVHSGIAPEEELADIIRIKRPWVDYYTPEYTPVEFAGRSGLRYEYTNELYGISISNISFLSEAGDTLLTLTGPTVHPIMADALSSLDPTATVSDQ